MRISTVIAALMISTLPAAATPDRSTTRFQPLDDGSIVVSVTISGTGPYRFVLDTGSSRTVISTRLSQALRLPVVAATKMITPVGTQTAYIVKLAEVALPGRPPVSVAAAVVDADSYAAGERVDGLIGQDVLAGTVYTIDYRARRIIWHLPGDDLQGVRVPLTVHDNRVLVQLAQFDGDPTPLILVPDSGSDSLVLFSGARNKLRFTLLDVGLMSGVSGNRLVRRARVETLMVGGTRMQRPLATIVEDGDSEGLMGDGLLPLHGFSQVTFNLAEQYLIVQGNQKFLETSHRKDRMSFRMQPAFWTNLDGARRDLAHAARSLMKDRGFALVCVISLGIGMGAVVGLSTFGRLLMAPAPLVTTDGLAEVLVLPEGPLRAKAGVWALEQWSYPDYRALREGNSGMSLTGWVQESSAVGVKVPDETELRRVSTLYVSANYFSTFGVTLAKGPGFDPQIDDAPNGDARVVLSHDFWKTNTNADPDIVGKSIVLEGVPHTVVGVTPDEFNGHFHRFQAPASLVFLPLERHPRLKANPTLRDDRAIDWVHIHGRLASGVTMTQANSLVATTVANLARQYPSTNQYKSATVQPYASMGAAERPQQRQTLGLMLALGGAVLLVVCLNISGMMMVRGTRRERELCIRAALGAERRRLIQHLFFEALWIAVVASAISVFVLFGVPAIVAWKLGVQVPPEVELDAVNVLIASGLCLTVSVLFGLLPAVRFSRPNLNSTLKEDSGGGGRHNIRMHRIAAMVQIGIAVPFLVVSGVMIDRSRTADFGFATEGIAGARVPTPKGDGRDASFAVRRVRDQLRQASGVQSVAMADGMPIDFDYRERRVANKSAGEFATAHVTHVAENFLETLGTPLLRGRTITAEDRITGTAVAVISQPLAQQLFASKDPLGETVTLSLEDGREEDYTVIGVSADFATSQLTTLRPQILVPLPEALPPTVHFIVRGAAGDEPKLKAALETALRELGVEAMPGVAFPGIVIGQDLVDKSIGDLIAEGTAVGVIGGLVLVLAALGIIGVIGFMVATRTREIAVRMALGSTRLRIFSMMLSDIVKLVIPGVGAGLLLAALLIRTLDNVLGTPLTLGPEPLGVMEPIIYAIASAIAVGGALLAALPAARRATTVQPMTAIRE